ncbi:MAG: hypothetical protein OHK0038_20250 [Flammeovirgaceae bacterium]
MAKQARVEIPVNTEELLRLAQIIYEKHQTLGNASPLSALDWDKLGTKINETLMLHLEAEELKRKSELKYRERDALLKPIDALVKQTRDLLKALYRSEPKKLGEFGFNVDDTPKIKKMTE